LIQAYFFCSLYHFCVTHPSLPGKTTLTPTLRIRKNTQKTTLFFEHGRLCADQRQSSNLFQEVVPAHIAQPIVDARTKELEAKKEE